jgi:hypothetical protein
MDIPDLQKRPQTLEMPAASRKWSTASSQCFQENLLKTAENIEK